MCFKKVPLGGMKLLRQLENGDIKGEAQWDNEDEAQCVDPTDLYGAGEMEEQGDSPQSQGVAWRAWQYFCTSMFYVPLSRVNQVVFTVELALLFFDWLRSSHRVGGRGPVKAATAKQYVQSLRLLIWSTQSNAWASPTHGIMNPSLTDDLWTKVVCRQMSLRQRVEAGVRDVSRRKAPILRHIAVNGPLKRAVANGADSGWETLFLHSTGLRFAALGRVSVQFSSTPVPARGSRLAFMRQGLTVRIAANAKSDGATKDGERSFFIPCARVAAWSTLATKLSFCTMTGVIGMGPDAASVTAPPSAQGPNPPETNHLRLVHREKAFGSKFRFGGRIVNDELLCEPVPMGLDMARVGQASELLAKCTDGDVPVEGQTRLTHYTWRRSLAAVIRRCVCEWNELLKDDTHFSTWFSLPTNPFRQRVNEQFGWEPSSRMFVSRYSDVWHSIDRILDWAHLFNLCQYLALGESHVDEKDEQAVVAAVDVEDAAIGFLVQGRFKKCDAFRDAILLTPILTLFEHIREAAEQCGFNPIDASQMGALAAADAKIRARRVKEEGLRRKAKEQSIVVDSEFGKLVVSQKNQRAYRISTQITRKAARTLIPPRTTGIRGKNASAPPLGAGAASIGIVNPDRAVELAKKVVSGQVLPLGKEPPPPSLKRHLKAQTGGVATKGKSGRAVAARRMVGVTRVLGAYNTAMHEDEVQAKAAPGAASSSVARATAKKAAPRSPANGTGGDVSSDSESSSDPDDISEPGDDPLRTSNVQARLKNRVRALAMRVQQLRARRREFKALIASAQRKRLEHLARLK